ncbi:MAG: hypothetical protein K6G10_07005 [Butyrivibrio sp.]|nr:hypothetical protein [Butyrivibrio sp.]
MERNKELVEYDMRKVYEDQITPLLLQIKQICIKNRIPCFMSCAVSNMNGVTTYEQDGILTGSNNIELYQDRFPTFLLVDKMNLVPASNLTQFDESTIGSEAMEYITNTFLDECEDIEISD